MDKKIAKRAFDFLIWRYLKGPFKAGLHKHLRSLFGHCDHNF